MNIQELSSKEERKKIEKKLSIAKRKGRYIRTRNKEFRDELDKIIKNYDDIMENFEELRKNASEGFCDRVEVRFFIAKKEGGKVRTKCKEVEEGLIKLEKDNNTTVAKLEAIIEEFDRMGV